MNKQSLNVDNTDFSAHIEKCHLPVLATKVNSNCEGLFLHYDLGL